MLIATLLNIHKRHDNAWSLTNMLFGNLA